MVSKSISSVTVSCIMIVLAVFLGTSAAHSSGIFEVVTPYPGTDLANCVAQARAPGDNCGAWNEDIILSKCNLNENPNEPLRYRYTWELSCYFSLYCAGPHISKDCGAQRFIGGLQHYDIYQASGPRCSKIGQSIRVMCIEGNWDPAQYEKTTIYVPDTYMVTDKNAGAPPAGMCNTFVGDGGQGNR